MKPYGMRGVIQERNITVDCPVLATRNNYCVTLCQDLDSATSIFMVGRNGGIKGTKGAKRKMGDYASRK